MSTLIVDQYKELDALVQPIMKFLEDNHNPHTKVLIGSNYADLLDGKAGFLAKSSEG